MHRKSMAVVLGQGANSPIATPFILRDHAEISIVLARLAEHQTQEMVKQTTQLIKLTWALVIVSLALVAFALVQTAIMFKQDLGARAQQIQAGQHQ
jgi:hypothetical protein